MKVIAKCFIADSDGKILLLRRSITHPNLPHHNDLPGGEANEGEDVKKAVSREVFEETGLKIPSKYISPIYEKKIEKLNALHIVCIAHIKERAPDVKISWEHDKHFWITKEELLNEVLPDNVDIYYLTALEGIRTIQSI